MARVTIELPDALARQVKGKELSQQQLQNVLVNMIQAYLRENQSGEAEHTMPSDDRVETLLDLRGSVPVNRAQDFDAIRQQVIHTQFRKRAHDDE